MAPEQLENREVTPRSDIYALGLLLYEIVTGRRAFEGKTLAEILRARSESTPSTPSELVKDLDPAVERVILRCLERDPQQRPGSVLAVAAALPGGDPLAAALAAGETPSPQLVADAGEVSGLSPRAALACLAAVIAGLAASLALSLHGGALDRIALEPPEALAQKARDAIARLAYATPPLDTAQGVGIGQDLVRYLEREAKPKDWNEVLDSRLPLLYFWYRTSPQPLLVWDSEDSQMTPGRVGPRKPPATLSGMINLALDAHGRLIEFQAIPAQREEPPHEPAKPDWDSLFGAAGLERGRFQEVEPLWVSLAASDTRAAWTGTWPGTAHPLRIEAAAFHGRPVFFSLIGPWTKPERMQPLEEPGDRAGNIISALVLSAVLVGAVLLARRNWVQGRGDRRGALRLAAAVFAAEMAVWLCRGHMVGSIAALGQLMVAARNSLFIAGLFWLVYLSLEPYVRRRWPQTIISWSRVLAGRLRDPLVGRDVVWGVILGILWALMFQGVSVVTRGLGAPPAVGSLDYLGGSRPLLGAWLAQSLNSVLTSLVFFFVLFLLRVLLRKPPLAAAAFVALFAASSALSSEYPLAEVPTVIAVYTIAVVAVLRFGFVTLAVGIWTVNLLLATPVSAHLSSWYANSMLLVFSGILALACAGFYTALAGRALWSGDLLE
jgi:serine/threonine-protein kinase